MVRTIAQRDTGRRRTGGIELHDSVERILRVEYDNGGFLFEEERHRALAAALGLPEYSAGFGYRYLARSISEGEPLSTGFVSNGVLYEEPKPAN
jgi:hypothetical protein